MEKDKLENKNSSYKTKEKNLDDLMKNKPYFLQRITSSKLRARIEKEKIRNVTHKVDNYLRHLENLENETGLKVLTEDVKKPVVDKQQLEKIVSRLYKVKKVEKKEKVEKDVKKLDEAKAKAKNVKHTEILLPKILKQESYKYSTEMKENVEKTVKRGKSASAFSRVISNKIGKIGVNFLENNEFKPDEASSNFRPKLKKISNDDTLSLNFMSNIKENKDSQAIILLKNLVKEHGYDMKKLKEFQKKHPEVEMTNYFHKAKMHTVKSAKKIKKTSTNEENNKLFFEAEELIGTNCEIPIQENAEENIAIEGEENNLPKESLPSKNNFTKSYLYSCIYNHDEFMKAHLLASKSNRKNKNRRRRN